jgi:hypothetical protein
MFKGAVLAAASLFFLNSCKAHSGTSQSKSIIGADNRTEFGDSNVGSKMGYLLGPISRCSASLVDKNKILTAAHCVSEGRESTFQFQTADNSFSSHVLSVASRDNSLDTLFLTLAKSTANFFEVSPVSKDDLAKARIVAFDPELGAVTDLSDCMRGDDETVFRHKCDTIPGYSGAPFIENGRIVAMHLGYDFGSRANIGVRLRPTTGARLTQLAFTPEVSCGDDCYTHCRRKVLGNWVPNPGCESVCVAERQTDCIGTKTITVCGTSFAVTGLAYMACSATASAIPPACTGMAAATAGSSCAVSIGLAAKTCDVAVAIFYGAATACIAQSTGVKPSDVKLEWK